MDRDEFLARLSGLRQANVGGVRAPHKPLLLLFGRFAANGTSAVAYEEAEEPVSRLVNEFGPAVVSPSAARQRAAMPFVHLERDLWNSEMATELRSARVRRNSVNGFSGDMRQGDFAPRVEQLLAELICSAVGLDLAVLT